MIPNGPLVTAPRTGRPARPPRRHWDFRLVALRVLAPAAAVAVLAAGGYGLSRIGAQLDELGRLRLRGRSGRNVGAGRRALERRDEPAMRRSRRPRVRSPSRS